ncbi:MAG TPA: hypothetical protein VJU84_03915 [Pyrinomonadaceae bacterium]|nr:hypothetical protein [Pyrinomonadaceae bacterium]
MSKDNENIPAEAFTVGPAAEAIPRFTPDQMVTCESCLRSNPPTRLQCLYCGGSLPLNSAAFDLQKPELRPLENWEQGYNNILKSSLATKLSDEALAAATDLLKLDKEVLNRLISSDHPLPVARTATRDKAALVQRKLSALGIDTEIIPDVNLVEAGGPFRVRAAELSGLDVNSLKLYERQGGQPLELSWRQILLVVVGRLTVQRVESREESSRRKESRVLEASEFFTDETTFDFYSSDRRPFRIMSKSFDFSCLGPNKGLVAQENMTKLLDVFREKAGDATWNDSYILVRKSLESIWPLERSEQSAGWRRDRPGKLTKGNITEFSNEAQFHKYSSLCHLLRLRTYSQPDEQS